MIFIPVVNEWSQLAIKFDLVDCTFGCIWYPIVSGSWTSWTRSTTCIPCETISLKERLMWLSRLPLLDYIHHAWWWWISLRGLRYFQVTKFICIITINGFFFLQISDQAMLDKHGVDKNAMMLRVCQAYAHQASHGFDCKILIFILFIFISDIRWWYL